MPNAMLFYLAGDEDDGLTAERAAALTQARRRAAKDLSGTVAEIVCDVLKLVLRLVDPDVRGDRDKVSYADSLTPEVDIELGIVRMEGGFNAYPLWLEVTVDLGLPDHGQQLGPAVRNALSDKLLVAVRDHLARQDSPVDTVSSFAVVFTDRGRIWGHQRDVPTGDIRKSWGNENKGQPEATLPTRSGTWWPTRPSQPTAVTSAGHWPTPTTTNRGPTRPVLDGAKRP